MRINPSVASGIWLMLLSDVLFAAMAGAQKVAGHALPAAQVVFVRSLFSMCVLGLVLRLKKIPLKANEPGLLTARALVGFAALMLYFWAIPQIPLGTAVMLNYLAPIAAVCLSYFALGEKPPALVKALLPLSFIGIYALTAPHTASRLWPLAAAGASGVLAGSVQVMIRQSGRTDSPLLVIFYFTVACTLGSGAFLWQMGWTAPDLGQGCALAAVTLTSLAGQLCLTYALFKAPIWAVSPFGYLTPVLGSLIGLAVWDEIPSPLNIAGAGVVILSGVALILSFRRADPTASGTL